MAKYSGLLLFLLLNLSPCRAASPAVLPPAKAMLDAGLNAYDHAKTIQATIILKVPAEQSVTTTVLDVQAENAPDGQISREKIVTTSNARDLFDAVISGGRWVSVYDGQTFYTLYPTLKKYRSQQGADRFSNLFRPAIQQYQSHGGTLTASLARSGGRPVFLLQGSSRLGVTLCAVVDRADHALRKLSISSGNGRAHFTFTVTALRLNAVLPIALSWKPPADYEELKTTVGKPNEELPDLSRVASKPPPAVPSATAAEARDWMQKMFDAQQQLHSYSADGEKTEEVQGDPGGPSHVTAKIQYQLPNLVSLITTVTAKSGDLHTIAACDGQWLYARTPGAAKKYLRVAAPQGRAAYDQACAVFVSEDNFFSPGTGLEMMMRGESPLAFLSKALGRFSLATDTVIDNVPVKAIRVQLALTASGVPLQSATYFIGRDDFLLRRLIWKEKWSENRTHTVTQTFTNIKANPDLPASAFAFVPPEGAKAVSSLDP